MYLTEDNRINNVSTKIPIMGFIDIENINDNNICDVDYKLKNLINETPKLLQNKQEKCRRFQEEDRR